MAGQWYATRIVKPMRIFQTNIGVEFSIFEKTGLKVGVAWKKPYLIYCYRELISNRYQFDGKLILQKINDDKYKFVAQDSSIESSSVIDVLVIESDEMPTTTIQGDGSSSSVGINDWKTIEVLSSKYSTYKLVELNKENDYTVDISDMGVDTNDVDAIYFIKDMTFLPNCYHIKIDHQNISSTKIKANLLQKYCDKVIEVGSLKDIYFDRDGVSYEQTFNITNAGSIKMEIHCESASTLLNYGNPFVASLPSGVKAESMLCSYLLSGRYVSYYTFIIPEFNIDGKNTTVPVKLTPSVSGPDKLKFCCKYFYTTTTNQFFDTDNFTLMAFIAKKSR